MPYWKAFFELSSSRRMGMGVGAIPYSEVCMWLDENLITIQEERIRYRHMISAMDVVFLEIQNKDDKKK